MICHDVLQLVPSDPEKFLKLKLEIWVLSSLVLSGRAPLS